MTDADPYHDLDATARDHLLAAAWYAADHDTLPSGATVGDTVGELAGTAPGRNTTSRALARLVDAGYIERVDGEPMGQARGVRVTDAGQRVLARGAARLDAAATVEPGGIVEVNEGP